MTLITGRPYRWGSHFGLCLISTNRPSLKGLYKSKLRRACPAQAGSELFVESRSLHYFSSVEPAPPKAGSDLYLIG